MAEPSLPERDLTLLMFRHFELQLLVIRLGVFSLSLVKIGFKINLLKYTNVNSRVY
jgi:hypothetical protein